MTFAGVSFLGTKGTRPRSGCAVTAAAASATGYHLLVVDTYSRSTKDTPTGECILSRPFRVGGCRWVVKYYPNGCCSEEADAICLYLLLDDESVTEAVEAQFEFSLVDETEMQTPAHIRATKACTFVNQKCWEDNKIWKRDALERSKHLTDDCFTIRCDIFVTKGPACSAPLMVLPPPGIHENFGDLLRNKEGADVVFEVGGVTFPVHRCVLAARSTVFKAQLFGSAADGAASSTIRIDNMEANVFKALLVFIYTDSLPEMEGGDGDDEKEDEREPEEGDEEESAEGDREDGEEIEDQGESAEGDEDNEMEEGSQEEDGSQVDDDNEDPEAERVMLQNLLVAADKYNLERLKLICGDRLGAYVDVNKVTTLLVLAEQYRCSELKEVCMEFFKSLENLKKVMADDGLEHVTRTCPSVLKELLAKFASTV